MGQVWWHSTLILALWRQREVDLRLPGRPGDSQDSQSYVERLYPHALQKKRKEEKERKRKNPTWSQDSQSTRETGSN